MKKTFNYLLGVTIMLIGILIALQTCDWNPLFIIKGYEAWITEYYSTQEDSSIILLVMLGLYCFGFIVIMLGLNIILCKKDNNKSRIQPEKKKFGIFLGMTVKGFLFILLLFLITDFFILGLDNFFFIVEKKIIMGAGILLSSLCVVFFPTFDVGKYLNTQNIDSINLYKREYRFDFIFSILGYAGIFLLNISGKIYDTVWWVGLILIGFFIFYIINLFIVIISKNKKRYSNV